ncbi:MAG TPA: SIR2 family protein [Methylocella sp.]|nr:SIR2 family protein [Methylocella sp.]
MKPKLTILLGAGSTLKLGLGAPDAVSGMPSTAELTERIARLQFPAAVRRGVPFVYGPDQKYPFSIDKPFPLLPAIYSALSGAFRDVDFELILHAVEQLQPLVVSADPGYLSDRYHPVVGAFTEVRRRFDLLCDWTVLLAVRRSVISEIYTAINSKSVSISGDRLPLHTFIQSLEKEFQISVFTLNYDDLVDGARSSWFDGFTGPVEGAAQGHIWTVKAFDARLFDNWRDATEPLLAHLHGSVRFGYMRGQFGVGKYSDSQAAFASLEVSVSDQHSAGQIVSASPIISGLSKVAKLALNPEPFGYYYRAFVDAVLGSKRLLVIGYGARDDHVNTWLEQFQKKHADGRRVVWICKLPGTSVGERTMEKDMIQALAGPGNFQEYQHYDCRNDSEKFKFCGALGLVPSGFPVEPGTEAKILDFLKVPRTV